MSTQMIKLIIAGVLLLHGIAHVGPFLVLVGNWKDSGAWLEARSWLIPSLNPATAKVVAIIFWVLSMIGFIAAAAAFWGVLVPGDLWRPIAFVSAMISAAGIVLFAGNWPPFNTIAAQAVNLAVIVSYVWLKWPPQDMFGK